ncbi:MAG: pirin family protein [Planctomycetota bacterium]|nr:pirin family protein [Planctomycetota bacterium]
MTTQSTASSTLTVRRAADRGHTLIDWLDSRHTFSFGGYQDDAHMGFGPLRVINDDRVGPSGGFGEHGHRDMEILTWVLDGELRHRDSLGHESTLRPGQVQVMSAGKGIRHSEFNASSDKAVHFLQVWIMPDRAGHPPAYAELGFRAEGRQGRWQVIASGDGHAGSALIHQDATVSVATLKAGQVVETPVQAGRRAWLHVALGEVRVNDVDLHPGDAVSLAGAGKLSLKAAGDAEVMLFDLP